MLDFATLFMLKIIKIIISVCYAKKSAVGSAKNLGIQDQSPDNA